MIEIRNDVGTLYYIRVTTISFRHLGPRRPAAPASKNRIVISIIDLAKLAIDAKSEYQWINGIHE